MKMVLPGVSQPKIFKMNQMKQGTPGNQVQNEIRRAKFMNGS